MKEDWKECKLGEVLTIKYGKNQKEVESPNGTIPIYGTGGLMGYATKFLYDKPSILIGRKGTINKVKFIDKPFWTVDTLFYSIINEEIVSPKFLYYQLSLINFMNYNEGTTIPSLRTETLNRIEVSLPPLATQQKIATILSSLDDKIELNNKINDNLEQQAQAIFKSWFVDFEPFGGKMPEGWRVGKLGDFVEIKRGGSPRPIQNFLSDEGYRWLKISDVTSLSAPFILNIAEHIKEEGLSKTVFLKAGSLVLSNSATPGIPKILDLDTCIHDGWLYFPKSQLSNEYLYLLFKEIRPQLVNLGNGSIFTNLKTDILKNFEISMPDEETLSKSQSIIKPMFEKMLETERETKQLETIRDTLLPKLMNGEIKVDEVKM
ncbi:MAG: restriction endonuclease subunit S [Spirochaetaceae bacterium]|nr:restriction endonuclease subunit S [Spirochaetaceae bacterium]